MCELFFNNIFSNKYDLNKVIITIKKNQSQIKVAGSRLTSSEKFIYDKVVFNRR